MAEKNNSTCSICGNEYYACLSCRDSIQLAPWKIHCCSSEHYKVFQIVRGISTNVYTKDEARIKFKNVDLSDIDSFRPHIKSIIEDVLKEPIVEVKEDTIVDEETTVVKKTVASRRKNYKVETE